MYIPSWFQDIQHQKKQWRHRFQRVLPYSTRRELASPSYRADTIYSSFKQRPFVVLRWVARCPEILATVCLHLGARSDTADGTVDGGVVPRIFGSSVISQCLFTVGYSRTDQVDRVASPCACTQSIPHFFSPRTASPSTGVRPCVFGSKENFLMSSQSYLEYTNLHRAAAR